MTYRGNNKEEFQINSQTIIENMQVHKMMEIRCAHTHNVAGNIMPELIK